MYKLTFLTVIMMVAVPLIAQKSKSKSPGEIRVPMSAASWQFDEGSVEFLTYKNAPAMKIGQGNKKATIKDLTFSNGIIEFDVEPILPGFAQSVYFHRKDDKEQEIVYLRLNTIGNKLANEGIQYTPYFAGINMWDMYPHYQGPAPIVKDGWNHLKLVISGKQMKVYMNRQPRPVLWIPKLEGNLNEGTIAFEGTSYIANVVVRPNETEGLPATEGPDLTDHDANYLRVWVVSKPSDLPNGSEANVAGQPSLDQYTDSIKAEREGFINLTRKFGANESRKVIWLKTRITTKQAVKTKLQLGFSDEVWVFLNDQTIYVDKNLYRQNMRKYPNGRMSIDNASINLNLKEGDNDLMIAVANDFYGWGIAARLESAESVVEVDNVRPLVDIAKEVANLKPEIYEGTFATPDLPFKLTITTKQSKLFAQATGQPAVELQALGKHTFQFAAEGAVFEFKPQEKKMILRQGGQTFHFTRE
jgi:hypothetical protein